MILVGKLARIVDVINCRSSFMLSVDVPFNICAATSQIRGNAIRADITVSLIVPQFSLYTGVVPHYTGEIIYAPQVGISLKEFTPLAKFRSISDVPHYTQHLTQQKTLTLGAWTRGGPFFPVRARSD